MRSHGFPPTVAVWSAAVSGLALGRSIGGVPLFDYETHRLEDIRIDSQHADSFAFDAAGPIIGSGECKPRPGDHTWPSQQVWDAFDEALGGVLIRTVPSAATCHENWGVYDSGECDSIIRNWSNPYFQ